MRALLTPDRNRLVRIIAEEAAEWPDGVVEYLDELLLSAPLPKKWQLDFRGTWGKSATTAANKFVNFAVAKGINPGDRRWTTLGQFLTGMLEQVEWAKQCELVAFVLAYDLCRDEATIDD